MLGIAIAITSEAFKNKSDKSGEPYILHCIRVMLAVKHLGHDAMCVAIMHDLLEDCPDWTVERLRELGFNENIIHDVKALTHTADMSYDDYIKWISYQDIPRIIKMADLRDNSDITRLKGLTKKDHDRMEKYHRAYTYLKEI